MSWYEQIVQAMPRGKGAMSDVARRAGLHRQNLSRYIHTGDGLSVGAAERLADVLGLELAPKERATIRVTDGKGWTLAAKEDSDRGYW